MKESGTIEDFRRRGRSSIHEKPEECEAATPMPEGFPHKGDTIIGNDVGLGYEVLMMPGRREVMERTTAVLIILSGGGNTVRMTRVEITE
ncbi:MAG: hypothetical protein IT428_33515 [Planctomycetaceae bacterium]|nr:hypothetical protein [Planctomycetaceae bacterium]